MRFLENHTDLRHDPRLLLPEAASVVSLLVGYKPSRRISSPALIAQYAYGPDYHERLKAMLHQLIARLADRYPGFEAKPCVDTVPISDKLWAARAGLGWIGRNTLLINPRFGSYCFLGELVTTAAADRYDSPLPDGCGTCRRCIDACPNQALQPRPAGLTAAASPTVQPAAAPEGSTCLLAPSCTAYHTIENRSPHLPPSLHRAGYAFGCDCCQLVCPHNLHAPVRYQLTDQRKQELEALAAADPAQFARAAKHSALSRINYAQWQRNLTPNQEL